MGKLTMALLVSMGVACKHEPPAATHGGFDDEVAFLRAHGATVDVVAAGTGHIAISKTYQMRVMTSEVEPHGASLGFVHHKFIEAGKTGTQFDNYGGEDRFWLGPEGGQWGLYFPPGAPYTFANWQTPHPLQEGTLGAMSLLNHSGARFDISVERTITPITTPPVPLGAGVHWAGFTSHNTITNRGDRAWNDKTGMVSIWILGMYNPSPDTKVVVPFNAESPNPVVNDRYFGKVPAERLVQRDGFLLMTADGNYRSKIGVPPGRAKGALGSYSPSLRLLTVVMLSDAPGTDKTRGYVNSLWEDQHDPLGGDVVNAYNDGPVEPGKPALGGFYELETSSPAAALAPGESLKHDQTTYHFVGDEAVLEPIARALLGVSLRRVAE